MQLLQQRDIIGRTSELARVFGIQFYHVLTRGSQVRTPDYWRHTVSPAVIARHSSRFCFNKAASQTGFAVCVSPHHRFYSSRHPGSSYCREHKFFTLNVKKITVAIFGNSKEITPFILFLQSESYFLVKLAHWALTGPLL